jgi:hypothetical protein
MMPAATSRLCGAPRGALCGAPLWRRDNAQRVGTGPGDGQQGHGRYGHGVEDERDRVRANTAPDHVDHAQNRKGEDIEACLDPAAYGGVRRTLRKAADIGEGG